ncbi:MAG: ABC transporter C-terminal domain-containing protein [Caldivirga sp.]
MVNFTVVKAMEVLEKWISDNGLIELDRGEQYLVCKEGNNTVMYRGLYLEIPTEGDVAKEIALMAKDRVLYNKYYIVTTPDVANFIDGALVKKLGIGVVVVDGASVREVMRSTPIETPMPRGQGSDQRIEALERGIRALEARVKELEDKVDQLMQALAELKRAPQRVEERWQVQATQGVNVQVPSDVPSFVRDNPWLGILMSKGKPES